MRIVFGRRQLWLDLAVVESADAGGAGLTGRWDRDECERFGDRIQDRIEITDVLVYTPNRNALVAVMRGEGAGARAR